MSESKWKTIFELVPDALALPANQRDAFLDQSCRRTDGTVDKELKAELVSLLNASAAADSSGAINPPLAGIAEDIATEQSLPSHTLPRQVGPWKPTRRIGSGGMGVVYAAERIDESFEQQAALKLIRDGFSADFHDRFIRERAILASLVHPGIARLLDGGLTDDGSPYIALELVDGQPLTDYADANKLDVRTRIDLFLEACDAVAFAHQNLVVHRDLKPSNILVSNTTGRASVKLLDFGIAKLLDADDSLLTKTGTGPMTPAYAAPEQLLHQTITTATDVYSLGVVLYELLTGTKPYNLQELTAAETERVVTTVVPPPPSRAVAGGSATSVLSADLDVVAMKALSKDVSRRYQSAEALGDDLRRYLGGWPVRAKADTVSYRLGKFIDRHKVGVYTSAAVFLLVASLATWFAISITTERRLATAAATTATAEAQRAEAVAGFLERILRAPNARWYVSGEAKGPDTPVRDVLDEAALQIDLEFPNNPDLRADLHHIMGDTYYGLGLMDQSEKHHQTVLQLREALYPDKHPKIAEAYYYLSLISNARGDNITRIELLRDALERVSQESSGNNYPFIVGELAHLEIDFGSLLVADSLIGDGIGFVVRRFVEGNDGFAYRNRSLYSYALLRAETKARMRSPEEASVWLAYADSVGALIALSDKDFRDPLLGDLRMCVSGLILKETDRYDEAEQHLISCTASTEALYGDAYLSSTPASDLVELYQMRGQLSKAEPFLDRARAYDLLVDSVGAAIR